MGLLPPASRRPVLKPLGLRAPALSRFYSIVKDRARRTADLEEEPATQDIHFWEFRAR